LRGSFLETLGGILQKEAAEVLDDFSVPLDPPVLIERGADPQRECSFEVRDQGLIYLRYMYLRRGV
jgi:hypothetical protein